MSKANKRKCESENSGQNKRLKTEKSDQKSSSAPKKGMNDMPNEMLLNIFSYLGQKDILSATLVNKKWNNLITNTEKTMRKIQKIHVDTENIIRGLPKFTRSYTEIVVENIKLEYDLDLLNRLKRIGDGIKTITFDHCWFLGNSMTSFLKCFKNVEKLHFTHCQIINVPIHRKILLGKLKSLHLDINTWPLKYIETPKLTKFQCHTIISESQEELVHFLNQQRHLMELDLNCIFNLFNSSSELLNPKFKLKILKLNDLEHYNEGQMMRLLSPMTESLTQLHLGIDMGLNISKFALQNFVNLQTMSIDAESLPTSPSFYDDSIKTRETLKKVEITGDLEKTMTALKFFENHPEIESLDLSLCFNIPSTRHSFWSRLSSVTQKVTSLKLDSVDADNIRYIKNKSLKQFKIYDLDFIDIPDWIDFCRSNPNIEQFHVFGFDDSLNINHVEIVLNHNLPKLKDFSVNYSLFNQ